MLLLSSCTDKKTELVWTRSLFNAGSQSSPRAADLNGDGVLDIVMGGGRAEKAHTDEGVFAINGLNGEILWQQAAEAHIVGSATFYDITDDGTPDVFIGGRVHQLLALNGRTGAPIWQYQYQPTDDAVLRYARYNFYNSTLIPDQDADGYPDLLTVNGGNWDAAPYDASDRHPGVLMLFSLKTGAVLAADTMPDGKECYMSPLCFQRPGDPDLTIVFGTGGETISGGLYLSSLSDLKARRLSHARLLVAENNHGFIAPPVLSDINADRIPDIIAVSHAATVSAFDGKNNQLLWQQAFPGMESSNALAVGQFTGDKNPDLLAVLSRGVWPTYTIAQQIVLDGKDGKIAFQDSIGCFSLASPVVYDLDGDGMDEAILTSNDYGCNIELSDETPSPKEVSNRLLFVNFQSGAVQVIDQTPDFRNIFSTPWLGDLDNDGYLDLVYPQYYNAETFFEYRGMQVKRISTSIRMKKPPHWGQYMGSEPTIDF